MSQKLKFQNATAELMEYERNLETTYFIFVETELDKRGKMFKAVKDKEKLNLQGRTRKL